MSSTHIHHFLRFRLLVCHVGSTTHTHTHTYTHTTHTHTRTHTRTNTTTHPHAHTHTQTPICTSKRNHVPLNCARTARSCSQTASELYLVPECAHSCLPQCSDVAGSAITTNLNLCAEFVRNASDTIDFGVRQKII